LFLANVFSLKHPFFKIHFCKVWRIFQSIKRCHLIPSCLGIWAAGWQGFLPNGKFKFSHDILFSLQKFLDGCGSGRACPAVTSQPTAPHSHSVASQTTALHSTAAQVSTVPTPYSTFQSRSVGPQHFTVQQYNCTGQYSSNNTSAQHLVVKVWLVEPQHFTAQQYRSVDHTTQCRQKDDSTSGHSSTVQYSTPTAPHSTVLSVKPQHITAHQHRSV
jgi:hypothetical protein